MGVKFVLIFIRDFEIQEEIFIVRNGYLPVVVYLYHSWNIQMKLVYPKLYFTPDFSIMLL